MGLLAALVVAGGWAALRVKLVPGSVMGAADCRSTTVEVAVVPAVEQAATAAATALSDECREVHVVPRTTSQVVAAVNDGSGLPDLWVPDSEWPLQGLYTSGVDTQVISAGLASTPVVLVGGPGAAPPASWGAALDSGLVAMPDPETSTVGTLMLVAPEAEARRVGRSVEESRQLLVPLAQAFAERRADGRAVDVSLRSIVGSTPRLVPATEQAYLAARRANDALQALAPKSGALLMTFPLVGRANASSEVLQTGRDLAAWFESPEGVLALRDSGLRAPGGAVAQPGGVGKVTLIPTPAANVVETDLRSWKVLSVPSSVLAVFDVSGSMDFAAGAQTRIQLASGVALTALRIFPDHARIGLWVFSIQQGGPDQDWRVLEPLRRLDAVVGGQTQRKRLESWAGRIQAMTTGGTGLYDTALAAYREGVRSYDENYSNSVILLTDGANDDPNSIDLRTLLRELQNARDPQHPVRIIGIAISQDADFPSLRKIARATGGEAYLAEQPEDVVKVFAQAIASR